MDTQPLASVFASGRYAGAILYRGKLSFEAVDANDLACSAARARPQERCKHSPLKPHPQSGPRHDGLFPPD
jgi:hypothetical protein